MEEKAADLKRETVQNLEKEGDVEYKERPSTTGGRLFGTVSEGLHSQRALKSNLDLPSGCICREEIKRLEKEILKKEEETDKLKKVIKRYKISEQLIEEYVKSSAEECKPMEILQLFKNNNVTDDQMHLAVLYSSPLGYEEADSKGGTQFKALQQLSFEKDIDQITKSCENTNSNKINYSLNIATPMNFISALSKNPYIIHFIGHGIKTSHFYKKEDYLVLENDDGSGQLVSSTKLKMIIDVCNSKLDTVFLSS